MPQSSGELDASILHHKAYFSLPLVEINRGIGQFCRILEEEGKN